MPNIFEKHRRNISFYYLKEKSIYWNFDVHFIYFDNKLQQNSLTYFTNPICDQNQLIDISKNINFEDVEIIEYFKQKLN